MATHSSVLAWEILRTEEPGGLLSMGPQKEMDTTERLNNNGSLYWTTEILWHFFLALHTVSISQSRSSMSTKFWIWSQKENAAFSTSTLCK